MDERGHGALQRSGTPSLIWVFFFKLGGDFAWAADVHAGNWEFEDGMDVIVSVDSMYASDE